MDEPQPQLVSEDPPPDPNAYDEIYKEVIMETEGEDKEVLELKKRICIIQMQNPEIKHDASSKLLKSLEGKTKEELEHILSSMEVSADPSLAYSTGKTALRGLLFVISTVLGYELSYERLSQKPRVLKYLQDRVSGYIGAYGEEFEVISIFMEEFEISEKQKNEEKA